MADSSTTVQKVSAEALGTFVLVFIGCGTAIFSGGDYVAIGLAFGLTVLAGAYAFGRISGAHFNPAISVGAALGGRMAWRQVPVYVGSQLAGAVVAGLALFILVQGIDGYDVGDSRAGPEQLRRRRHRLRVVGGTPGRDHPDRDLRLRDPRRHRRPQRAPGPGAGRDRPDPHDDPLRVDQPHRHLGQPGSLHRRRDLRRRRRDHPALAVHRRAVGRRVRSRDSPTRCSSATAPTRWPARGCSFARPAPAAVPGYGAPDQYQQEWNQQQTAQDQAAWEQEPIIQDGWQWDHAAQEWKPLEQWQAPAPPVQAAPVEPTPAPAPAPRRPQHRRRPSRLRRSPFLRSPLPRFSSRRSRTRARRPPSSARRSESAASSKPLGGLCSSAM